MNIAANPEKIPQFKSANPQLPLVHPGISFEYDFVANNDIYPDYNEAPYLIELATEYINPAWLRIENNRLIADFVPENLSKKSYELHLTIKNIPGGRSEVIKLTLYAMT
ncbi:MAG: hypothetical protein H0U70_12485 [Tatlockia sp.]|nr:hypothetical protein [Tatlockia sp.]